MARNDFPRKPKKDRTGLPDADLLAHIRSLGLATVEDYLGWCARHGFSRRTDKHWRVRLKERGYANRATADARLAEKKQEIRRPEKVIERIYNGDLDEDQVTQPHLKAVVRACQPARESRRTRVAFHDLLHHVGAVSGLVSGRPVIGRAGNTFVDGLLALARHSRNWVRAVAAWKPQTHNARRQFGSLARHLARDELWARRFLGHGAPATVAGCR